MVSLTKSFLTSAHKISRKLEIGPKFSEILFKLYFVYFKVNFHVFIDVKRLWTLIKE